MKLVHLAILILAGGSCFAQNDQETLKFLHEIIKRPKDSATIYYTDKTDPVPVQYMLRKIKAGKPLHDARNIARATLILSSRELASLKDQLNSARGQAWKEGLFAQAASISPDSARSFLSRDRGRILYMFSRPAFIRKGTIAFFYLARLCCGDIYGPVDLAFYKKTATGWEHWISVDGGAF